MLKELGADQLPKTSVNALKIKFHTNDEDKDDDTGLSVVIAGVAAWTQTSNEHYADHGDYIKDFKPESAPLASLHNRTFTICIKPNGNDTWRFNYKVYGLKSDGS